MRHRQKDREINSRNKFGATIHSEKITNSQHFHSASGCASSDVSVRSEPESLSLLLLSTEDSLLLLSVANVNSQQLYVFTMNNKSSSHSNNKCNYLFAYFHSLASP
jgi:hypothetical protein